MARCKATHSYRISIIRMLMSIKLSCMTYHRVGNTTGAHIEILTLPEHLSSPSGFSRVRVARSLMFCVMCHDTRLVFCDHCMFVRLLFCCHSIVSSTFYDFWLSPDIFKKVTSVGHIFRSNIFSLSFYLWLSIYAHKPSFYLHILLRVNAFSLSIWLQ
jgi:hypothetical protein